MGPKNLSAIVTGAGDPIVTHCRHCMTHSPRSPLRAPDVTLICIVSHIAEAVISQCGRVLGLPTPPIN